MKPAQRYQPASDLHHTILSLFPATADCAPYLTQLPAYLAAVAEVAAVTPSFAIDIRGVTLTPGAVLAQGFPRDATPATVREHLRAALHARGLGDALDQRYRLVTAHMTLVRFATPLDDPQRFVAALATARGTDFGLTMVGRLELLFGDCSTRLRASRKLRTISCPNGNCQPTKRLAVPRQPLATRYSSQPASVTVGVSMDIENAFV
ncbi:MAG: hypothetical protein H0X13_07905 [Ramlibacter sp.]|nr:hypothetical protein [Ramlibacter sp.]